MLRWERKRYAAARLTTAAVRPTATIARLFSPAKTTRTTIARPASTKLRRASQRWAGVLFGPFMVGSSAVSGLGASPVAGWLGQDCGRGNHPVRGDDGNVPGRAGCLGVTNASMSKAAAAGRAMILPLALAQFIASYAATNMNVAISAIATDLGTDVAGVQTAITLFTLTMAALMIPGSKLTDIWGRKRCFVLGLVVYGIGGLLAALSAGLPQLIVGYSLLEGVGSALMIPPIYILVTVTFPDVKSRAR